MAALGLVNGAALTWVAHGERGPAMVHSQAQSSSSQRLAPAMVQSGADATCKCRTGADEQRDEQRQSNRVRSRSVIATGSDPVLCVPALCSLPRMHHSLRTLVQGLRSRQYSCHCPSKLRTLSARHVRTMTSQGRGAFIVFEGTDRCGKSTQSQMLVDKLRQMNVSTARRV